MNRLLVLDAHALLHRSYHALPSLTSSEGLPVGAVYGFVSMVLRLFSEFRPTGMIAAFDRPEPTFRDALYPAYQANRPKADEEFVRQLGVARDVLSAFRIPLRDAVGYEADDVIGTIVRTVSEQKERYGINQIIIVTGDRDILQLVRDDGVFVYMPTKGLSEGKLYGEDDVAHRLGVRPSQVVDFKALCGDSSDNYKGVAGIGPKTAATLLHAYDSLETIYAHLEEARISDTIKRALREGKDQALLAKSLAKIRTDAPIDFKREEILSFSFESEQAIQLLYKLGFVSLVKRIMKQGQAKDNQERQDDARVVNRNQLNLFS